MADKSLLRPTALRTTRDHHERKSILRGSGRGREIRRGFLLGTRHRDLLYQQPLDPLGDPARHPGLALRDLRRAVWVVVGHSKRVARMSESDIRDHSNTAPDIAFAHPSYAPPDLILRSREAAYRRMNGTSGA